MRSKSNRSTSKSRSTTSRSRSNLGSRASSRPRSRKTSEAVDQAKIYKERIEQVQDEYFSLIEERTKQANEQDEEFERLIMEQSMEKVKDLDKTYIGAAKHRVEQEIDYLETIPINVSASSFSPGFSPVRVLDAADSGWGSAFGDVIGWMDFDFGKTIFLRRISMKIGGGTAQVQETMLQGTNTAANPDIAEFDQEWANIDVFSWDRGTQTMWSDCDINEEHQYRFFRMQVVSNHGDSVCSGIRSLRFFTEN